eukprot:721027-Prorocentrum_minimum.AAC.1
MEQSIDGCIMKEKKSIRYPRIFYQNKKTRINIYEQQAKTVRCMYYKHPTELYKELHQKNYNNIKEKKCRQIFLRNLKRTTRTPHDKSILYYELKEEEVEMIRKERIENDPDNKESLGKIYDNIIEKIRTLKK